jgi:hypothetical protein
MSDPSTAARPPIDHKAGSRTRTGLGPGPNASGVGDTFGGYGASGAQEPDAQGEGPDGQEQAARIGEQDHAVGPLRSG